MELGVTRSGSREAREEAARADLRSAYLDHAGPLYWYALALLGRAEEAEDVVHDVFAALLQRRGTSAIRQPRAYLLQAVRRAALHLRRRRGLETSLPEDSLTWVSTDVDRDRAIDVDRALKALPEEQREVVALKVLGELTFREIAQVLGIRANTAASRYRLALAKLRTALSEGERG
jgi:RNA polymerase sigma factor (sigma-70 family)